MERKQERLPLFSILVVSLNPGRKLLETLESVWRQSCTDYEVIVKDGGSRDGSVEEAERAYGDNPRLRIVRRADKSIYEGMNQAVEASSGRFLLFLNCGDSFYHEDALKRCRERALGAKRHKREMTVSGRRAPMVLYGDTYGEKSRVLIKAAPVITGFTCYRNIPCHQSCFYERELLTEHPYIPAYRIRADYEHFLWCFYRAGARMVYLEDTVAAYEGGGYSESADNRRRDRQEHREITRTYIPFLPLLGYRLVMALTLAPVRRRLAEESSFSGLYHRWKNRLYRSGRSAAGKRERQKETTSERNDIGKK